MEENVTLLAAFGAGLLSFISPCVLPLIPGYLSYVSGLSLDDLRGGAAATRAGEGTAVAASAPPGARRRVVVTSLAFILGFSLVFVSLGASASAIGQFLMSRLTILNKVAGAIIIVFGLHTMGVLRIEWLYQDKRIQTSRRPAGFIGAVLVGMFNYMIGNTDWSAVRGHNTKLMRTQPGEYLTVPYDFDFSGAVDARYASPDPSLTEQHRLRRVTDRLYRGLCRSQLVRATLAPMFNAQREALWDLYISFERLEEDRREDALEFYEDFYETLNDERKFEREVTDKCRTLPG